MAEMREYFPTEQFPRYNPQREPTTTESVENLILEQLLAIRADIGTLKDDNVFMKARMSSIEHQMAGVHADFATVNGRMDSIEKRLDRIEKRLELSNV